MRLHDMSAGLVLVCLLAPASAQPMGPSWTPRDSAADQTLGAGNSLSIGGNMSPELRSRVDQHLQATQDLRLRMATATTPEQRQALQSEHLRLMDENMSLMQQMMMGSGGQMPGMPGTPSAPLPTTPSTTPGSTAPSGFPGSVR